MSNSIIWSKLQIVAYLPQEISNPKLYMGQMIESVFTILKPIFSKNVSEILKKKKNIWNPKSLSSRVLSVVLKYFQTILTKH